MIMCDLLKTKNYKNARNKRKDFKRMEGLLQK